MVKLPFQKSIGRLVNALAEKGTAGIILLSIFFFIVWIVPVLIAMAIYTFINNFPPSVGTVPALFYSTLVFSGVIFFLSILFATVLSINIFRSIVPTIRAEAEATLLLDQAFGGRVITTTGGFAVKPIRYKTAKNRILKIMDCLTRCAADELDIKDRSQVRSNIFISDDNQWLRIAKDFHVNMKGTTPNDRELTIRILNGYFSSGTAYKYFRPVLSVGEIINGKVKWEYPPDEDSFRKQGVDEKVIKAAFKELEKTHDKLSWIISIPIPFQKNPFEMSCGVLNLDGISNTPLHRDILIKLLADTSTAAALIGVMNRTSNILKGQCQRPPEKLNNDIRKNQKGSLVKTHAIDPKKFDPAECPEPTEKFKNELSKIQSLEFMKRITTTDVAMFLREQLQT